MSPIKMPILKTDKFGNLSFMGKFGFMNDEEGSRLLGLLQQMADDGLLLCATPDDINFNEISMHNVVGVLKNLKPYYINNRLESVYVDFYPTNRFEDIIKSRWSIKDNQMLGFNEEFNKHYRLTPRAYGEKTIITDDKFINWLNGFDFIKSKRNSSQKINDYFKRFERVLVKNVNLFGFDIAPVDQSKLALFN